MMVYMIPGGVQQIEAALRNGKPVRVSHCDIAFEDVDAQHSYDCIFDQTLEGVIKAVEDFGFEAAYEVIEE